MTLVTTERAAARNTDRALTVRPAADLGTQPAAAERRSKHSVDELAVRVEGYPEPIRTETRFVQAFFIGSCNGQIEVLRELARTRLNFPRSSSYFLNWINGAYFKGGTGNVGQQGQGDWLQFCELLRRHDQRTAAIGKMGTIITPTVRAIDNYVKERMASRVSDKVGAICGMTGMQKGASLKLIAASIGFPRAVYIECRGRDSLIGFQRKLALRYNTPSGNKAEAREAELEAVLHEDRLLIVGNIQRAYNPKRQLQPIFEWLMEVQEDRKFTLIFEFKRDEFAQELSKEEAGGYFEQLVGRIGGRNEILMLPEFPPVADLKVIARAMKLPEGKKPLELLEAWSKMPGRIRVVFKRLERAQELAQLDDRTSITLEDLQAANDYTPPASIEDEGGAA